MFTEIGFLQSVNDPCFMTKVLFGLQTNTTYFVTVMGGLLVNAEVGEDVDALRMRSLCLSTAISARDCLRCKLGIELVSPEFSGEPAGVELATVMS